MDRHFQPFPWQLWKSNAKKNSFQPGDLGLDLLWTRPRYPTTSIRMSVHSNRQTWTSSQEPTSALNELSQVMNHATYNLESFDRSAASINGRCQPFPEAKRGQQKLLSRSRPVQIVRHTLSPRTCFKSSEQVRRDSRQVPLLFPPQTKI